MCCYRVVSCRASCYQKGAISADCQTDDTPQLRAHSCVLKTGEHDCRGRVAALPWTCISKHRSGLRNELRVVEMANRREGISCVKLSVQASDRVRCKAVWVRCRTSTNQGGYFLIFVNPKTERWFAA